MRCLRAITTERLTATVFLSKENYDTLNDELHKNFNMEIKDLKSKSDAKRSKYPVHVLLPLRKVTLKRVRHEYTLREKSYCNPVNFGLENMDLSKYASTIYTGNSLAHDTMTNVQKTNADYMQKNIKYSELSLAGEVARYLNISCILAAKILREATDGIDLILKTVSRYNQVINDVIIPTVFSALFEITTIEKTEDKELVLLHEPKNAGYYEFSAKDDLVIKKDSENGFSQEQLGKSFHVDTYCFDSLPEKICFEQYISNKNVAEVYFTGMFTSGQGDLSVYYYDPESGRLRQYYPDFLAKMKDESYRIIEVKGDNMIDNSIVKAKADAAHEMALASGVEYIVYKASDIMSGKITI